jgi:hypothetical protein
MSEENQRMIIWLSGYAKSGKDTAASYLCQKYGFVRLAFADILKIIVSQKYGFPFELTQTQLGKTTMVKDKTVREWLIYESLKMKENDPYYFAKVVFEKILDSKENIVISDWRYPSEYQFITNNSLGTVKHISLRICRPCITPMDDLSEHQLDDWQFDHKIANTDIDDLHKDLDFILQIL